MLDKIQSFLEKTIGPLATKLQNNKTIKAISEGVMITMPVTVGGGIIALLTNVPFKPLVDFIAMIGLKSVIDQGNVIGNWIGPLLTVFTVAYAYAKNEKVNPVPAGIFGFVVYMSLVPVAYDAYGNPVQSISTSYFGGNGVILALILSIVVAKMYCLIIKKGIKIKLPESVPPMIAQSFEPMLGGIIILGSFLILKAVIASTTYADAFTLVNTIVSKPLLYLGGNVSSVIILFTLANLFWFFGIHPLALISIFTPVISQMYASSIGSMMAGTGVLYSQELSTVLACMIGGTGGTLGLVIILMIFAKSDRYKSIMKIASVPGLCNINEPLIFGLPVMMNPIMFLPMVLNPVISAGIMNLAYKIGFITNYNPIGQVSMPWTIPVPFTAYMAGGIPMFITVLVITAVSALLYFPFFITLEREARQSEALETSAKN